MKSKKGLQNLYIQEEGPHETTTQYG
jgi:hypothetical protein